MDLKSQWKQRFNSNPPKQPQTIKMVLDWYGASPTGNNPTGTVSKGVSTEDEARMNRIIARLEELSVMREDTPWLATRKLPSNTKIIKTWRGKKYEVSVMGEGYSYDGMIYKSLSKIAKVITGTHQSGNIFFGVTSHQVTLPQVKNGK